MDLVGGMYGKEHANLKHSIWEKGFKKGKMDGDRAIDLEIVEWLDKAIDKYYRDRIYSLLDEIEHGAKPDHTKRWNDLLTEMFGNSEAMKRDLYKAGQDDPRVGKKAKIWLSHFINS